MQKLQKVLLKYILRNRLLLKAHRPPLDQQSPLYTMKAHPNTQKAQAHIWKPVFLLSGFGPCTTKAHKVTKFPAKKKTGFREMYSNFGFLGAWKEPVCFHIYLKIKSIRLSFWTKISVTLL